jgi:DegV family protein with EDD domain
MYATATSAAEKFGGRVQTFDSQQLTLGLGFQVLEGAIAAQAGSSMNEVLEVVEYARSRVEVLAMINSMEYLRRSGRVSWIQAGVSDVLQIKVLLNLEDGEVKSLGRTRTRRNALRQLKEITRSWGSLARLAVLHSGIPEEASDLAEELKDCSDTAPLVVDVTTIIGAHVGPGSMGLAALRK